MIIGTCFTLFVVPAIYVLVTRTHRCIEETPEPEPARELERATA